MNQFSDQMLARRMLQTRDRGYSFALFFRRSAKRYVLLVSCLGLALVPLALLQLWMLFYLILGMVAGSFLRDVGWVRAIRKTWPFGLKVTDWDKVQELADEKDVV